MKYTVTPELLAGFAESKGIELPFDSITFEFADYNDMVCDCNATKTTKVDLLNYDDTDSLMELAKLAKDERDRKQLASDLKWVTVPSDLTQEQLQSIVRKWKQNPDGTPNLAAFFHRVRNYGDYCGLNWCGMFLGIERDGHTHS